MRTLSKTIVSVLLSIGISTAAVPTGAASNLSIKSFSQEQVNTYRTANKQHSGFVPAPVKTMQQKLPQQTQMQLFSVQESLPSSFDLRKLPNIPLTKVKNQGTYENCWAYAAIASLESNLLYKGGWSKTKLPALSSQYLQFIGNYREGDNSTFDLTYGGNPDMAIALLARGDALVAESAFDGSVSNYPFFERKSSDPQIILKDSTGQPLLDRDGNKTAAPFFKPKAEISVQNIIQVTDATGYDEFWNKVGTAPTGNGSGSLTTAEKAYWTNYQKVYQALNKFHDTQIKQQILQYGAIMSSYFSDMSFIDKNRTQYTYFNKENNAYYYDGTNPLATSGNHAINIVGWDDNYSIENFNQTHRPSKNGAWVVRNSWGDTWGENGYFYISYEDVYIGSNSASFIGAADKPYTNNYTYANFGFSSNLALESGIQLASVFPSSEIGEQLTAISAYISEEGVTCSFYARTREDSTSLPDVITAPLPVKLYSADNDESYSTKVTIDNIGYFTFTLKEPINLNGKPFEIVMKLEGTPQNLVTFPIEYSYPNFSENATEKTGECYVYTGVREDGRIYSTQAWIDFAGSEWETVCNNVFGTTLNSSLCLYAHTTSNELPNQVEMFTNTKQKNWNGTFITSQYDNGGHMLTQKTNTATVQPTSGNVFWTKHDLPKATSYCKDMKAFLWNTDALTTLSPLSPAFAVSKTE